MREELIRVDYGRFQQDGQTYQFDISVSRGECIGIYVDDHLTSGTAYLGFFKGSARMTGGHAFSRGRRVGIPVLERWIARKSVIVDRYRFASRELTVRDFLLALGKSGSRAHRRQAASRLISPEAVALMEQMGLCLPMDRPLAEVSPLDYYRLSVFRFWLLESELLILDRLTEVLRQRDLEALMVCVRLLQEHGAAVLLFDLDESFMQRCCDRIDVVKDRHTCYRLYPDEYGSKLYTVMGWNPGGGVSRQDSAFQGGPVVLETEGLTFPGLPPLDLRIRSGEIALLRDENDSMAARLRACFLSGRHWLGGTFRLDGRPLSPSGLQRAIGSEIGILTERPDRINGMLFNDLTALDDLTLCLLPKAGKRIAAKQFTDSILTEAARFFPKELLQTPLRKWPMPERLRFAYYKWYLLNPKLLICFFPFQGQETAHHEMIVRLLTDCAQRGMAVWIISDRIDAVCEKTDTPAFLHRLRYLN